MILKYRDSNGWNWVTDISNFTDHGELEPDEWDRISCEIYIEKADPSESAHVFQYTQGEVDNLLVVECDEAFLINSETGSTIDVLVR